MCKTELEKLLTIWTSENDTGSTMQILSLLLILASCGLIYCKSFSIYYYDSNQAQKIVNSDLVFNSELSVEQLADICSRSSGRQPLLWEGSYFPFYYVLFVILISLCL